MSPGEQLYKLDRLVAKAIGGRPFDTLSAMAGRGQVVDAEGWELLGALLDAISPYHARHAMEDQARREATGVDDHIPIEWPPWTPPLPPIEA